MKTFEELKKEMLEAFIHNHTGPLAYNIGEKNSNKSIEYFAEKLFHAGQEDFKARALEALPGEIGERGGEDQGAEGWGMAIEAARKALQNLPIK